MRRSPVVASLSLILAACGAADRPRTAVSDSTAAPRIQPGSVAGAVTLQLWQLREGVTLGDWKGAHPDEAVSGSDSSGATSQLGTWCAAAQRRDQVGARIVTRTAFFYPPSPPANLAPPDSAPDLVMRCRLGVVWVRVETTDTMVGAALADSIAAQLRGAFGAPDARPVQFFGSALWNHTARFQRGDVTAVTALRAGRGASKGPESPAAVLAFGLLPLSGLSLDGPHARLVYEPADSIPLDSAAAIAHADTALFVPLRTLMHSTAAHTATDTAFAPRKLTEPLRRWLTGTTGLLAPRRAAALYVADVVLERLMCSYRLCDLADKASRAPLEALGARFTADPLGASWVYQRNWLTMARNLDRDSPLGQKIFLVQLGSAFDFTGGCAGGTEGFRRVIDNGEKYLERVPASPIAADVHYQVAEAYRDIVALAHGAAGDYADSSRYGAESGGAALKALSHYRSAMAAGSAAPVARAAWERAWWLRAGLMPRDVRFYCVND